MMKRTLLLLSSLSLLAAPGCALLKSNEPRQTTYTLRPAPASQAPQGETGPARIVELPKPDVPSGFERDRIALYLDDGRKLDYYASARWAAPFNIVAEDFTRRALAASLPNVVQVTPVQSVDADYRLQVRINDFQPVYRGSFKDAPRLMTSVSFTLVNLPDESIVTSFTLSAEQDASSPRLDVIISELSAQLDTVQRDAFTRLEKFLQPAVRSGKSRAP